MVDGHTTSDRKRKDTKVFLLYICTPHHNRRIHCKEKRKKEQTQNRKKGKRALSENTMEDLELTLWMMNLVAHHVADNRNWLDTADELKNWGNLFLSEEDWEVPPPLWAITREKNSEEYRSWVEEEKLKELKENEEAEESLVTTSLVDLDLKELKEEKENEEAEESLVTTSPVDLDQNDSGGSYVEPLGWRRGRWNHLCRIAISKKNLCIHS